VPKFQVEVPHKLGAEAAKAKLDHFIEMIQGQAKEKVSDLSQGWVGNTLNFGFKTYGIKISGAIDVREDSLHVAGDLPFTAMMFKGKIESEIREQLGRLVA
jgi:putative polyhydroxyalkanoate system protein